MLSIRIHNDGTGTDQSANYTYYVFINRQEIERGEIGGHSRSDGWAVLLKSIAEQHLTTLTQDE